MKFTEDQGVSNDPKRQGTISKGSMGWEYLPTFPLVHVAIFSPVGKYSSSMDSIGISKGSLPRNALVVKIAKAHNPSILYRTTWRILEDHPRTCKWLITMVSFRPLNGVSPHINGRAFPWLINGGDPNYLHPSWEPILQVGQPKALADLAE